jgi:branched-chain amino acid aminotransferase group I
MKQMVYLNGQILPLEQADISPLDYGFLYGYGLFETMRSYNGCVFRLQQHIARLEDSAKKLGIPTADYDLTEAVYKTLKANNLSDARIRLAVSLGPGGMTPNICDCKQPTILITTAVYKPYPQEVYDKGFKAVTSSLVRYSLSPLAGIKSANYLENMLAKQEAVAADADEALLLNEHDCLAEACMSNVFLVLGDRLVTPSLESGILPGITRRAIIEIASDSGVAVSERDIFREELLQANEAFLTNSLMEIMPLTSIDGRPVASGKPGPITRRLMQAYRELVDRVTSWINPGLR